MSIIKNKELYWAVFQNDYVNPNTKTTEEFTSYGRGRVDGIITAMGGEPQQLTKLTDGSKYALPFKATKAQTKAIKSLVDNDYPYGVMIFEDKK